MSFYRRLGDTGLSVSVLGFGGASIGFTTTPDPQAFVRLLRRAQELGINFFDTAPDYRDSEQLLGQAFQGRRADVILATKVGRVQRRTMAGKWAASEVWTYAGVLRTIDESLRRLRTDYLDVVQLHSPPLWVLEADWVLDGLERARAQGKVRHIRISGDGPEARRAINLGRFDTLQISYNVLHQGPGDELLDLAAARGLGLIIKQPVANGMADRTERPPRPEWAQQWEVAQRMDLSLLGELGQRTEGALRWLVADPRIATAIVGTTRRAHLERNVAAARQPMAPAVRQHLRDGYRAARYPSGRLP
jgi:aryl-alcohol dehydrogenase-like predicted oxidoreductase